MLFHRWFVNEHLQLKIKVMNMSYCRFENTYRDLKDCYMAMESEDLSESEFNARKQMIELCWSIFNEYSYLADEEYEGES
jgi:hypothetical protein